ncbi:MAG: hypothetical protein JJU16_07035 [Alkalibacterium sp.]|nr:hypothetical protein [Alkalibacterium sp.]
MNKRMTEALIGGALLGVVCVIGVSIRTGFSEPPVYLFSIWYNRVIMGLIIGAPWVKKDRQAAIRRGALLGLLVSFAFFSTSGFHDPISFVAGIFYGVILEGWLSRRNNFR